MYNSVTTPRFFIDHGLWLYTLGAYTPDDDQIPFIQLNPTNVITRSTNLITVPRVAPINYIAFLGTEETTSNPVGYYPEWYDGESWYSTSADGGFTEIVNCDGYGSTPEAYNGFSMATFTDNSTYPYLRGVMSATAKCGAVSIGSTYEMPHSADLNLSISYETGTKTIETFGGSSLSNTKWRPPLWGNLGAWELHDAIADDESAIPITVNQTLAHSSRKVWNLSFNFLSKENVFPKYNALNKLVDLDDSADAEETLLTSDDFFSQVWNRVGTALPFIFQPDNDVNDFAICKFDQKSVSFKQQAPNLYSVKLKIREVW